MSKSKFRRKTVIVDAVQWFPGMGLDGLRFISGEPRANYGSGIPGVRVSIRAAGGSVTVSPGDWIVTEIDGKKYSYGPDKFEKLYEPVQVFDGLDVAITTAKKFENNLDNDSRGLESSEKDCSKHFCKWSLEDTEWTVWDTECGQSIVFDDGTPRDNGYKYCYNCGKVIDFQNN